MEGIKLMERIEVEIDDYLLVKTNILTNGNVQSISGNRIFDDIKNKTIPKGKYLVLKVVEVQTFGKEGGK